MDAVHDDQIIRGMYVMGENPAMSIRTRSTHAKALAKLEHLVVQDIFLTETAFHADVVSAGVGAWPEKDGTVTNTNRQVQIGRKALEMPGEARQDWWIIQEIATRIGLDWTYTHPSDVFAEMSEIMPSFNNITWDRLSRESAVTYPCDAPDAPGNEIVFAEDFPTPSGRGKLVGAEVIPPDEMPDDEYPMILTTGRQLEHGTPVLTRRASVLDALEPEAVAQLNYRDLKRLGVEPGDMVRVATRRGIIELKARVDRAVPEGVLFVPFCYAEAPANFLTDPQLDPYGKIPEFKFCAARVERATAEAAGKAARVSVYAGITIPATRLSDVFRS